MILQSPDPPTLSRPQYQRVFRASRAYKEHKAAQEEMDDSDDDVGPENDDAWLFEDLNIMLRLWMRKREKEQLLALIFEVCAMTFKLAFDLYVTGCDCRVVERYHYDILCSIGSGLQSR